MDKHLAVRSTSRSPVYPLRVLLVEIGAKVLCHEIYPCICGKCTMVGGTIVHPGPPVRDVLRGWCLEGSVSFGSSHCLVLTLLCLFSLIGFEELGNSDVFETAVLELRLSQSGEFVLLAVDLILLD